MADSITTSNDKGDTTMTSMIKQANEELINYIRKADDCGGHCSDYCCGCTAATVRKIKTIERRIIAGNIPANILATARNLPLDNHN